MRFHVNPADSHAQLHIHTRGLTQTDVQSGVCEAVVSFNMLIKPSLGLNQDQVNDNIAFTRQPLAAPTRIHFEHITQSKQYHIKSLKQYLLITFTPQTCICEANQVTDACCVNIPLLTVAHYTSNGLLNLIAGKKKHAQCPL